MKRATLNVAPVEKAEANAGDVKEEIKETPKEKIEYTVIFIGKFMIGLSYDNGTLGRGILKNEDNKNLKLGDKLYM